MALDPFTLVYDALWELLETHAEFHDAVRLNNRIKFSSYGPMDPFKHEVATADLPEVRLTCVGGTPHLQRTSGSSSCVRRFEVQILVNDLRYTEELFPLEWEVYRAMSKWYDVVSSLTWPEPTNKVTNPGFETASPFTWVGARWRSVSPFFTRDVSRKRAGLASLKLIHAGIEDPTSADQYLVLSPSTVHRVEVPIWIPSGNVPSGYVRVSLEGGYSNPTYADANLTLTDRWQLVKIASWNPGLTASGNIRLKVNTLKTNLLTHSMGESQEEIDLFWNNMDNGCLRAFFFDGDCTDEMAVGNGTATALTYQPTVRYWPQGTMLRGQAGDFNGATSKVSIGSAADIDTLTEFTIAFWTYCRSDGEADAGRILNKGTNTRFETTGDSGGYVGLYGKIGCATTAAESLKLYPLEKNEWHHVAFTYSDSGDRKIHIFVDGTEVTGYGSQIAGVGARSSDAADTAYIGDYGDGSRVYDGLISTFLIYNRILSSAELKWLCHNYYSGIGGDLRVGMWEKWGIVDATKLTHGMVCFQFDDGYTGAYTLAKPVFDTLGVVGNIAMPTNYIGAGGRLTAAQLQSFIASEWEIVSHSKTHTDPAGQTEGDLRVEFADSKVALEALGATVKHYAWPYAAPQDEYRQICAEYYESAADSGDVSFTNINLFAIPHITIDDPAGLATFKTYVDSAYTNNRLLTFIMHDVDAADVATLADLIAYVQAKPMPIVTRDQAFENLLCTPPEPLCKATSLKCQNVSASAKQFYQTKTLAAGTYVVSFLAYTTGAAVTSADVQAFADSGGFVNEILVTTFEHVGSGVYLCRGQFTATAGDWNIGIQIEGNKTVYVGYPSCFLASEANLTKGIAYFDEVVVEEVNTAKQFVKLARPTNIDTGASPPDLKRGARGWLSVWACEVELWFATADLQA